MTDSHDEKHVLLIEDTPSMALAYQSQLEGDGFTVTLAEDGAQAIAHLGQGAFPVVLLDLSLPDMDGLELMQRFEDQLEDVSVIVITADGSINRAVEAMRLGAYDYLVKPFAPARMLTTVRNASERVALKHELEDARKLGTRDQFHGFIGRSPAMQALYKSIDNIANSMASVFISGESGTGKEVCAEALHKAGPRARGPFIALNCGAIPKDLIESEIFGHLKGAFTGAISDRVGAAEMANGGTLFLDEICEMDIALQSKLLRFLQTGTIQKVGSSKTVNVDVRIICATNREPWSEVKAGRFREDLFFRLNVVPIAMPPLRSRGDDVTMLAHAFLERFAQEERKAISAFTPDAIARMESYQWPGNVRELQNVVRRAVVLNEGPLLGPECLELISKPDPVHISPPQISASEVPVAAHVNGHMPSFVGQSMEDIEKYVIDATIEHCRGSIPKAAGLLKISPSTIYRKMQNWEKTQQLEE